MLQLILSWVLVLLINVTLNSGNPPCIKYVQDEANWEYNILWLKHVYINFAQNLNDPQCMHYIVMIVLINMDTYYSLQIQSY
jgi:hypothetical protein